jgi:transcription elongation factor Elf1
MKTKVTCPACGYEMNIEYDEKAECKGIHVRCKGRNCHKEFEIVIKNGKQIVK